MLRELDVIVYGATGFVGRLCAQYLLGTGARLAIAGRDAGRLAAVARELGRPEIPQIVADSGDAASLRAMAERTAVVLTTVGPYAKHGLALVGACVEAGTHYCDLAGEVLFVRDSIDVFDAAARARGVTIVHAAGFDSVPSDLGVYVANELAAEQGLGQLVDTRFHLREMSGGLSGGTIDSLRIQIDSSRKGVRTPGRSSSDPYALSPDRDAEPEPRGRKATVWLERSPDNREWSAPFFMARFNEQIVRRSNALLGYRYGRGFRYREVHDTGGGAAGFAKAVAVAASLPAFVTSLALPGLRQLADAILPKPGEGPSERSRARGHFRIEVHAMTTKGEPVVVTVAARKDPGYEGTAVMIGQTALALAAGESVAAGVSTPAAALGPTLPDRLREAGFLIA